MKFWDTSAIVPLILAETRTSLVLEIFRNDRDMIASSVTPVEVDSALWRRRHDGIMSMEGHDDADRIFAELSVTWTEVGRWPEVVATARRVLARQPLRTPDALQLASSLVACDFQPATLEFVTLDDRLPEAARSEGFSVLP